MKNKTSKPWTEPELIILLDHFEEHGPQVCSKILEAQGHRRSRTACGQMGRKIGLKYQGPKLGCFRKGISPMNKGKKMSKSTYKKAAPTMFKKGDLPKNTKPLGSVAFRSDGYWWVKVDYHKWEMEHRLLWEYHNGAIPEGKIVVFKDGDPNNIELDNLELITRKEHVRRNRWTRATPSEFSLQYGRAARARLQKRGIGPRAIRLNPELLELAKTETLVKLQIRKRHDIKG